MDKLRKIGERLWYNKERVVLVAMVIVLCWNVYKVARPAKPAEETPHPVPKGQISEEFQIKVPPEQPPKPLMDLETIYKPNMFWSLSGSASTEVGGGDRDTDPGVTLVDIKKVGSKYRAKLKSTSTTKWYDENEKAEDFEVLSIDPDARTVKVRSERLGRTVDLSIQ